RVPPSAPEEDAGPRRYPMSEAASTRVASVEMHRTGPGRDVPVRGPRAQGGGSEVDRVPVGSADLDLAGSILEDGDVDLVLVVALTLGGPATDPFPFVIQFQRAEPCLGQRGLVRGDHFLDRLVAELVHGERGPTAVLAAPHLPRADHVHAVEVGKGNGREVTRERAGLRST